MDRTGLPRHRRGRILYTLLGALACVALLPLVFLARQFITTNRTSLETSTQEFQLQVASTVARNVEFQLEATRGQVWSTARAIGSTIHLSQGDQAKLLDDLARQGRGSDIVLMRFRPVHGEPIDSDETAPIPDVVAREFDAALARAAEALKAEPGGGPTTVTMSRPFLLPTEPRRPAIVLSAPVVAGGTFLGAIFAVADLQSVWEDAIAGRRTGGTLFAVDPEGRLLAQRDLNDAAIGENLAGRSRLVEQFVQTKRALLTAPFAWIEHGSSETYVGSYWVTRDGWGIIVQARQSEVFSLVDRMVEETRRWVLLAISLAMLASIILAKWIENPIRKLDAACQALMNGDLGHRVVLRSRNEFGDLATTLNDMAAKLVEEIRKFRALFRGTARAITHTIDAKDPYTRNHSQRVSGYAVNIAKEYPDIGDEEIDEVISVAAVLHDVGKIGVRDAVLNKQGPLTPDELDEMRRHPVLGAEILGEIDIAEMKEMLPGLRSHHERWDGKGYPDRRRGDEIPLIARIIAVADSFDAMTTDRPYQKAMSFEAAAARVNELKGAAFDPKVVEAFNRAFAKGWPAPDPEPRPEPREPVAV